MATNERIDVLAVMDRSASWIIDTSTRDAESPTALALIEARAAVAELIAADREYDAALAAVDANNGARVNNAYRHACLSRLDRARDRRAAALARVGGAP